MNREVSFLYGDSSQSSYYDEIIYKGFNGAERRIRINFKDVSQALAPGEQILSPAQLFPEFYSPQCSGGGASSRWCQGNSGYDNTPVATVKIVSSVVLPNNQAYQFLYNSRFEIAKIISPLGSYNSYYYSGLIGANTDGYIDPGSSVGGDIRRRVSAIKTFDASGQLVVEKDFSNKVQSSGESGANSPNIDNVTIDIKNENGTVLTRSKHYFASSNSNVAAWNYSKEIKSEILNPVTQTVLRKTETIWEQREAFSWCDVFSVFIHAAMKVTFNLLLQMIRE